MGGPHHLDPSLDRHHRLLRDHITIAVELLHAVRAEDTKAFDAARTRWYTNGNDMADFLSAANPRSWPDDLMRADTPTSS